MRFIGVDSYPSNSAGASREVNLGHIGGSLSKVVATATDANGNTSEMSAPAFIGESADLSVAITGVDVGVAYGETVAYHILVVNHGPSDATGVEVVTSLPDGVSFISASSGCAVFGQGLRCLIGTRESGDDEVVDFEVNIDGDAESPLIYQASVSSDQPDPNPENNAATIESPVISGVAVLRPVAPPTVYSDLEFTAYLLVSQFSDMSGAQATLEYDPAVFTVIDSLAGEEFSDCVSEQQDSAGELSFGVACEDGHSGSETVLWSVTFRTQELAERQNTELRVTDVELVDSSQPPQVMPSIGRTLNILVLSGAVCGDVNFDLNVSIIDAVTILQVVVELLEPTAAQIELGDVTGDGELGIDDVIIILQHIVGTAEIQSCG
jgi:uncharacterized repeat protein (TIGR01451 family)